MYVQSADFNRSVALILQNKISMRVIGEIPSPHCKITIFSWNNRYLVKFEQGHLEQTFKIDQYDVANETELYKIITEEFIQEVLKLFERMAQSLHTAMEKV